MMMMVLLAVCSGQIATAQDIYVSRNAHISFYSSAPIEDIQAETNKAVSAINIKTGSVYFKVLIKSFQFEKQLMQSHFNSDYLESDKFPYAEFKGTISDMPDLSVDGSFPVTVEGRLSIHGVAKDYQNQGTIQVKDGQLITTCTFKVRLADHNISIPRLLFQNIAEVVDVKVNALSIPEKAIDNTTKISDK